ncbi:MAG: signal peptidase I [Fibrobacterota bacterium]
MSEFYEVTQEPKGPRDLRLVLLDWAELVVVVLFLAFCFRQFLLQPFSVPGSGMRNTLLPGDRFFGNKFIYGPLLPFTERRLFPLASPAPGDGVIFRDPADRRAFAVRRCAAVPGDTVLLRDKACFVNGSRLDFPETADRGNGFAIEEPYSPRDNMAPLRVPRRDEVLRLDSLPLQQFDFTASIIRQENPGARITQTADLLINGRVDNDQKFEDYNCAIRRADGRLHYDAMNWIDLKNTLNFLQARDDSGAYTFRRALFMDGRQITDYRVRTRVYFLLGDNWDDSYDSRYSGFISERLIVARASFIFWSQDRGHIRWRRLFLFI